MPEFRSMQCDICEKIKAEVIYGAGFPGWGKLLGVNSGKLPGQDSLVLCSAHLQQVVEYLNAITKEKK